MYEETISSPAQKAFQFSASSLAVSPLGVLYFKETQDDEFPIDANRISRIKETFDRGQGFGLLHLGTAEETELGLPPALIFWRNFGIQFVSALCRLENLEEIRETAEPPFPKEIVASLIESVPPMPGSEYLSLELLEKLWTDLIKAFREDISRFSGSVQEFFSIQNSSFKLVGRVCFHLAENKRDPEFPFGFLATYTTRLSAKAKPQHAPLANALKEFAGAKNKTALLSLLAPVNEASEKSPFVKNLLDSGDLFHPLAWKPMEAFRFLKEIPLFEQSGIVCRIPDWWKGSSNKRLKVSAKVGTAAPGNLNLDSLLNFSVEISLDGESLTEKEWREIAAKAEGLTLIRGKWVEVDKQKLEEVLAHWKSVEKTFSRDGLTFSEGMRLLSGAAIGKTPGIESVEGAQEWSQVLAGSWLSGVISKLKNPETLESLNPGKNFKGVLRPYQKTGMQWLWFLHELNLGACLADDMGLGKTIQVLALFIILKERTARKLKPSLLIVPASLIANWESEILRFTEGIQTFIAHPSVHSPNELTGMSENDVDSKDLVITTYGSVYRFPWLQKREWEFVILDEAQAIKNPDAKQTRAVKALKSKVRIALTGTPVENRLSDLWSIFDFLNPGLLGTTSEFKNFAKHLSERKERQYLPLRNLVRPYILRRMKTDRNIINDLPDKTEMNAHCSLSKTQAVLYQESVKSLERELRESEGIQRKGIVLAYLLRFKQICNHPSQWLNDGKYDPGDSGKFSRLRELCELISSKGEKAIVFSQFREIIEPLSGFLAGIFGRPGLTLHGGTQVKSRQELVRKFQEDPFVPYMVLSLKAGGVGLNLTSASHVIHFDRWWNPAVENQATDRAFRIGQTKNVLVHKFLCRGTIEEKINELIESKTKMAGEILDGSAESILATEMSDSELLNLVSLDIHRALEER